MKWNNTKVNQCINRKSISCKNQKPIYWPLWGNSFLFVVSHIWKERWIPSPDFPFISFFGFGKYGALYGATFSPLAFSLPSLLFVAIIDGWKDGRQLDVTPGCDVSRGSNFQMHVCDQTVSHWWARSTVVPTVSAAVTGKGLGLRWVGDQGWNFAALCLQGWCFSLLRHPQAS